MDDADAFMIEFKGEILTVTSMYDDEGNEVTDRAEARRFGVIRENGKEALLRLPPTNNLEKVARQ